MFDFFNSQRSIFTPLLNANASRCVLLKKMHVCIFMAMIFAPSGQEALALEEPNVMSEFNNGGFMSLKTSLKNDKRVVSAIPDAGKAIGEGGSENRGGTSEGNEPLHLKRAEDSNKGNNDSDNWASVINEYLFKHGLIGFLGWIPLLPFFFMKPNA